MPLPKGVFSLTPADGSIAPTQAQIDYILSSPNVDGISIRTSWASVDQASASASSPSYNWNYLNGILDSCIGAGKMVALHLPGSGGGETLPKHNGVDNSGGVPDWIINAIGLGSGSASNGWDYGTKFFSFMDTVGGSKVVRTIPVYWNTTFVNKKIQLYQDIADHLYGRYANASDRALIRAVYIGALNAASGDWGVPDGTTLTSDERNLGFNSTARQRWLNCGYTTALAINQCCPQVGDNSGILDGAIAAFDSIRFPNACVMFACGESTIDSTKQINPPYDGTYSGGKWKRYCAEQIFTNAFNKYPGRVGTQKNDLSQKTASNLNVTQEPNDDDWTTIYDCWKIAGKGSAIAAQMVWFADDGNNKPHTTTPSFVVPGYSKGADAALTEAVNLGKSYGTQFQEIYRSDITAAESAMQTAIKQAHNTLNPTSSMMITLSSPDTGGMSLAFGDVLAGGTPRTLTLRIASTGSATLIVNSISYPNAVFTGAWNGTIAAGAHQDVTVTFAPTIVASYNGVITVNTDASGTNAIGISGNGISSSKVISLSPSPLAFGKTVNVNDTGAMTLNVKNAGTTGFNVTGITYSDTHFSTDSSSSDTFTVNPGVTQQVLVKFAPTGTTSLSATITVNTDSGVTGVNTVMATGTGANRYITLTPANLTGGNAFANTSVGNSRTKDITLKNNSNSNAVLVIDAFNYTANQFKVTKASTPTTGIPAGGKVTLTIKFTPTSRTTFTETITILSNANGGQTSFNCSGTGT